MLCLGGGLDSLPPQCGDVPISNWDWDQVDGEERLSGVTWGEYHVVGTYDGSTFTVLDVGSPQASAEEPGDPFAAPCPEPDGGWFAPDPSRTTDGDLTAAYQFSEGQPDSAGSWIDYTVEPSEGPYGPNDIVLVAAFTGDLDRHRSELAGVWGGPLCVTQHERTQAELLRIQRELSDRGTDEFGLVVLSSGIDVTINAIEVSVIMVDDETRSAVDAVYGEGVVRFHPALTPVD
jgi:hypothetical protein